MKILKFGGTSLGSSTAIEYSLKAIANEYQLDKNLIIVCSAMSGITDLLQKMARDASNSIDFSEDLKLMEQKHFQVIQSLMKTSTLNDVIIQLKILFNEIESLLEGIKQVQEVSPRTNDRILSYGERCSTFMISQIVSQFIDKAVFSDTRELICTDSGYSLAKVNFEVSELQIKNWYKKISQTNNIQVVTGFIAQDENGITTTLGRGGSDYTAAIFGAILKADQIQIWTDVNGFMTADPRLVPHAISLSELSYAEAMELSYFGAKVIYPPTMIPAIEKQIPIIIKNTFNPEFDGTLIHNVTLKKSGYASGIASISDVCLVNIEGSGMVGYKGFSGRLFSALARVEVNVIMITQASSEHSICFAIEPKDMKNAQKVIEQEFEYEILTKKVEKISFEKEVSILAVVGENMKYSLGLAGKVFQALGRVGVNIIAIAQGSSELNISMVIQKNNLTKAVNAIHNDLFLSKTKNAHLVIVGVGNIGRTLLQQIKAQQSRLLETQDLQLKIIGVSNSKKNLVNTLDLNFENWEIKLNEVAHSESFEEFIHKILSTNLPNIVFVDNTANVAISQYYQMLLENNISVVTCNKIATSDSQLNYEKLKSTAVKRDVKFLYETNVGAGLPIIKTLQDLIHSGDRVIRIEAILSGTISYIFNNYVGHKTFAEVVKDAQDKGLTEPNPVDDLSGRDFIRKMLIISRECGFKLEMNEIEIVPFLPIKCLESKDVSEFYENLVQHESYFENLKNEAASKNGALRFMGLLDNGKVTIKTELVPMTHPFYGLTGSDNIISITTQRYFNNPLVVKGPGAGAEVTAAGVFADIMRAASEL